MAGWAVAAGLVNFAGRAGLLAFLTSVADAAGCASGEIALIGNLHVAGLNFAWRSFRWGDNAFERSVASVAFGWRLARRHSERCPDTSEVEGKKNR